MLPTYNKDDVKNVSIRATLHLNSVHFKVNLKVNFILFTIHISRKLKVIRFLEIAFTIFRDTNFWSFNT